MEDLISKSKLFEWIKVELAKEYPDSVAQYVDGRETVLEILRHRIEQGVFSPDLIPLPTIKPGDKVVITDAMNPAFIGTKAIVEKISKSAPFSAKLEGFAGYWPLSSLEVSHD